MFKRLIVILGPTASGKSELAVKIAKRLNGEVISADSRQIYKGMDVGTGKITKKEMRGVPHHLLDITSPKRKFTVIQYQKLALKAIDKIFRRNKIPVLCGGTGFYVQAVVDGLVIPEVKPDWKLRLKLNKLTVEQLFEKLKKLDPRRAKEIDSKNPRRLIRAIEIAMKIGTIPTLKKRPLPYPILMLGVKKTQEELKILIAERLEKRLKQGMIAEVKKLHRSGVSWKRLEEFGLEYRWIARYLQLKLARTVLANLLQKDIEHFAKRQMTWFKKDRRIHWVKNYREAESQVFDFVNRTINRTIISTLSI